MWSKPGIQPEQTDHSQQNFSSASQVITRKLRSRAGVAARTHRSLIATSSCEGGNVTKP
jgi:hypothetical protein